MAADLGDRDAVRGLIVRLGRVGRPVDILVSNAGTIFRAPAAEHPDEAWDRVLEVNLRAASWCPATPPRNTGWPASPRRWPTNGPGPASTSTRSRRATSRPTTPRRCRTIPCAAAPS